MIKLVIDIGLLLGNSEKLRPVLRINFNNVSQRREIVTHKTRYARLAPRTARAFAPNRDE